MVFLKIQTNRMKIKEIIVQFSKCALEGEKLIVPRPLPGENFQFYKGYCVVDGSSENNKLLSKLKNYKEITEDEYHSEVGKLEYFWRAQA